MPIHALLLTALMLIAAAAPSARAEILIATAGPFTGTNLFRGEQIQHGAELAVANINTAGGVLGERLVLVIVDDACDPDQSVAVANKLVSDGVVFVAKVADDKFELVAENDMDEPVIGSPVPALNRIFLRGEKHLFCLTSSP